MAQYKLTYFNARGAAEIIRLVLEVAGQKFEDERVTRDQWMEIKEGMPMKQLPVMTITQGGKPLTICQTGAISKYLARKFGLFGSNEDEALLVDELLECLADTMRDLMKSLQASDDTTKAEMMKKFKEESIPRFYNYFKTRQAKNTSGYIVGSKLTIADLAVFNFVDQTTLRNMATAWDGSPDIKSHYEKIKKEAKVAAWLAKRPATDM